MAYSSVGTSIPLLSSAFMSPELIPILSAIFPLLSPDIGDTATDSTSVMAVSAGLSALKPPSDTGEGVVPVTFTNVIRGGMESNPILSTFTAAEPNFVAVRDKLVMTA